MFKDDDENEDDGAGGQTRYPVMPSLVALQQMRNRLHLAYLGKKLMKWSALATGKELRRLAAEINKTYANYSEDIGAAFLQLARARYFYPRMNNVVLENISKEAAIVVEVNYRSVSGVKVLQLDVIDNGIDPYQHLGIEKGGSAINDAKKKWRDLLKLMIQILEEKTSFENLDIAHKNATKRQNVLGKLVIPRIVKTIAYILDELEEKEREEFFRLKKILKVKEKLAKKNTKADEEISIPCSRCGGKEICPSPSIPSALPSLAPPCPSCTHSPPAEPVLVKSKNITPCINCNDSSEQPSENQEKSDAGLKKLKEQITGVIGATKEAQNTGLGRSDIDKFLLEAQELKVKLDRILKFEESPSSETCKICNLKSEGSPISSKSMPSSHRKLKPSLKSEMVSPTASQANNLELGSYETHTSKTTKILRVRNADGTITEEKKIVKTTETIRSHQRPRLNDQENDDNIMHESSKDSMNSNSPSYICCCEMGAHKSEIPHYSSNKMKTQSEHMHPSFTLVDPIIRSSISSSGAYAYDNSLNDICLSFISNAPNINDRSFTEYVDSSSSQVTSSETELIKNVYKNLYRHISKVNSVENVTTHQKEKTRQTTSVSNNDCYNNYQDCSENDQH